MVNHQLVERSEHLAAVGSLLPAVKEPLRERGELCGASVGAGRKIARAQILHPGEVGGGDGVG